ncbi:hypothetical protein H0H93_006553 [Arthromyces matolae]|nr:hypothetical protein H0H93_006553 [Arthromyces matolae]
MPRVTGINGFIGSNVALELIKAGYQHINLPLKATYEQAFGGLVSTEKDWSNATEEEFLSGVHVSNPGWSYAAAKALGEKAAWKFAAQEPSLDLSIIIPPFIFGPYAPGFPLPDAQSALSSNMHIYTLLNGGVPPPLPPAFVDVRDVALAHVVALGVPKASNVEDKRFLVCGGALIWKDAVEYLRDNRPELKSRLPQGDAVFPGFPGPPTTLDVTRAKEVLNLKNYRDWKETVETTVDSLIKAEKAWVKAYRKRFMLDSNVYPDFAGQHRTNGTASVISVSSGSDTSSAGPRPRVVGRPQTIVSSDEEDAPPARLAVRSTVIVSSDEEDRPSAQYTAQSTYPSNPIQPGHLGGTKIRDLTQKKVNPPYAPVFASQPTPIHIPSNKDLFSQQLPPIPYQRSEYDMAPSQPDDDVYISPADAEKAIRDLMSGGMEQELETEVDLEDATVKGFCDGITLLPHQVIGRAWMKEREDPAKKRFGGILADDMGLGKTIQTLTRIVEGRARKSDRDDGFAATTLVVCPLALIGQWASEISKMAENVTVTKHHGTKRTSDPNKLRQYRVVVTTYDVVKSEYDAYLGESKDESQTKVKKKASANSDEGSSDSGIKSALAKKPKKNKPAPKKTALFEVNWFRIVLDEAHTIKNVKTKAALSCHALEGKFRWCLTGTPMQNSVDELFSLMKFLQIKPFNNWTTFNAQVANPVKTGKGATRAMKRLQVVLKAVMLRRTKDQSLNGKPLLELPARNVEIVSCDFDPAEKEFYSGLENKMESVIEKLMGNGKNNYISVLLLLLRLRQACNHPILVTKDYKSDMDALEPKDQKNADDDDDTDDLVGAFSQLGVTRKCYVCTSELGPHNVAPNETDPLCRDCVPFARQAKQAEKSRPSSAKIRAIMKILADIETRSKGVEKTIIFSQFTKMLDLIEPFLEDRGIEFVRYDGSMDSQAREESLQIIRTVKTVRVILISFKAGSTGLNLTACNNVILVDLWWNPALEDQAFDRAHRFGQKRDVNIFKLKIDETVEDRILLLQEKKRELAKAALSGDKLKTMRLGMDDLLALFRPGGRDDDDD